MEHYVFEVKHEGVVKYVGKAKSGSDSHMRFVSGTSHCYGANKAYFSGEELEVSIVSWWDTERESYVAKKLLVDKIDPEWNRKIQGKKEQDSLTKYVRSYPKCKRVLPEFIGMVQSIKPMTMKQYWKISEVDI